MRSNPCGRCIIENGIKGVYWSVGPSSDVRSITESVIGCHIWGVHVGRRSNLGFWAASKSTRWVKSLYFCWDVHHSKIMWALYGVVRIWTLSGDDRWRYFLRVRFHNSVNFIMYVFMRIACLLGLELASYW
jgi:hypothetical protein